jgi:hypothetical protein
MKSAIFVLAAKNSWKYCSVFSTNYHRKIKLSQIYLNMILHLKILLEHYSIFKEVINMFYLFIVVTRIIVQLSEAFCARFIVEVTERYYN